MLHAARPHTPDQLRAFAQHAFQLNIPHTSRSSLGPTPLDYLAHAFFEDPSTPPDALVWANRGGGKTLLGALATVLDLLFKPGIQVRILAGSLEQSARMHEHVLRLIDTPFTAPFVAKPPTRRRVELTNGSAVELLAQSHRSVRGTRVHKLRCDEVDEFQPDVWQAAQLVTRSETLGDTHVRGAVHALSTLHRPFGVMAQLADRDPNAAAAFRWNWLDVAAPCPPHLDCDGCALWSDCHGAAKHIHPDDAGFVPIADLLTQRRRTDDATWASEMACQRPRVSDLVYPSFDPKRHVQPCTVDRTATDPPLVAGMDFGMRNPTVFLWARHHRDSDVLHIVAEHTQAGLTVDQHAAAIAARAFPTPRFVAVDPAGLARNGQTGLTDVDALRAAGHTVRAPRARLLEGVRAVRRRLDHDTLRVDPACTKLIAALRTYHFPPDNPTSESPVKDGPDHACDALRYLTLQLDRQTQPLTIRHY